jgi:hypothetical protein
MACRPCGARRRGHRLRRCSRTSTCTTSCHLWVDWWRHHEARGDVIVVRFADDFTVGFEHRDDADRFGCAIRERFARFGLELHPDKTRLIEFGRYAAERRRARGLGKPETFTFLGFTHICATGRGGRFWVRRKTDSKRMRAKLRQVHDQLKQRRYLPIPDQGRWLASVVRGHCAYYAVPGNDAAASFRYQVSRHWFGGAAAPKPAAPADLGTGGPDRDSMATPDPRAAPLPGGPLRRHHRQAGAQCGSPARWDLCGGRPEAAR